MVVNREFRHEVANNLAAFIRGEITNEEMLNRGAELRDRFSDNADEVAKRLCLTVFWDPKAAEHRISVDQEGWDVLVRWLAFLESPLTKPYEAEIPSRGVRWRVRLLAGTLPMLLVTAYVLIRGWDWGAFAVGWASFAPLAILSNMRVRDDKQMLATYSPFENEADWLAHRHLTERFDLPEYDPAIHNQPLMCGLTLWQQAFQIIITAPVVVLVIVLLVIFWPILAGTAGKRYQR